MGGLPRRGGPPGAGRDFSPGGTDIVMRGGARRHGGMGGATPDQGGPAGGTGPVHADRGGFYAGALQLRGEDGGAEGRRWGDRPGDLFPGLPGPREIRRANAVSQLALRHLREHLLRSRQEAPARSRTVSMDGVRDDAATRRVGTPEEDLFTRQDERRLRRCLSGLPVALRAAVLLRYHEDMTLAEVALRLRIGLSAAKMRIHRGLDLLRACMERAGGEEAKV